MPPTNKPAGQRDNTNSSSGNKIRSETSTPHKGSRQEPSHLTEREREIRAKKLVSLTSLRQPKRKSSGK